MMSKICIIPARGGSKRIPRKNIKAFLGKPIIAYSIQAALKSNLFEEVMVSTDDFEIAEIAKAEPVAFFLKSVRSTDFKIRSSTVLIKVGRLATNVVSVLSAYCCIAVFNSAYVKLMLSPPLLFRQSQLRHLC